MRTTIRLDDQLLSQVKQLAHERGVTMTAVIEDALRQMMARQNQASPRKKVQLITVSGSGVQPGVDLDDSAALLDFMERADDSA